MCLLLFAINEHPEYPLVVAANRDEFLARPTEAAKFWADAPDVLAGRDLQRGGTWLGVSRDGRWAAVTSFRDGHPEPYDTSRGHLVSEFLEHGHEPGAYATRVLEQGGHYAGFNLLVGNPEEAFYCSNRHPALREIRNGVHGLSNHLLNTPWPKLTRARERFAEAMRGTPGIEAGTAFEILACRANPDDADLPDTGVGMELERLLSSAFIASPEYGTRCSTVLLMDSGGGVTFIERTYLPDGGGNYGPGQFREQAHQFPIRRRAAATGMPA